MVESSDDTLRDLVVEPGRVDFRSGEGPRDVGECLVIEVRKLGLRLDRDISEERRRLDAGLRVGPRRRRERLSDEVAHPLERCVR